MRCVAYLLGLYAPIFFGLSVAILGALKPEYSHIYHTISELGETGGVTAGAASALFIVTGLMITVFGYLVQIRLRRRDKRVWTGVMIMLYGVLDFICSGVFPIEAGGSATTLGSVLHVYATLFGELAATGMPVWFIRDTEGLGQWNRHRRFSRIVFMASLPLIAFLGYCIGGHTPGVRDTPIGLAQRLLVGAFLVWIMGTAQALFKGMGNKS